MLQLLWFIMEKREDSAAACNAQQAAHKACEVLNNAAPVTFYGKLTVLKKEAAVDEMILQHAHTGGFSPRENNITHILYLADSRPILQALKSLGLPVACYRHEANREEDFSEASYVIEEPEEVEDEDFERIYRRLAGYPWTILHTARCTVREFTVQDAAALQCVYDDPQVRRFLPPLPQGLDKLQAILREYIQKIYGFYSFGGWAVIDRQTGTLIGRAGFALWDDPEDSSKSAIELGYLIAAPYRGKGIAAEVCSALLSYAKEHLPFTVIYARAAPDNTASCRLLERLGFHYKGICRENDNVYKLFIFL